MADFISREKEFRKLNEQLDDEFKRSTLDRMEKLNDSARWKKGTLNCKGNESQRSNMMNNDRFATYTKSKGQASVWMKKSGGGDYVSPPKSPTFRSRKQNYGNGFNSSIAKNFTAGTDTFMGTSNSRKQRRSLDHEELNRSTGTVIVDINQTNSARKVESLEEPLTIKYRNQKFSASPSLDKMIKEDIEKLEKNSEDEISDLHACRNYKTGGRPELSHVMELQNTEGKNVRKFVNTNGLIRFLKSKVALLEENQARTIQDMAQQKEAFEATAERLKLVQQQRDKALLKNSTLEESLEKLTMQLNEANRRSKEQSQESIAHHKELESLKRELKQLTLCHKSLETRHSRTKEELDVALKSQTSLKNNERELKENLRRDTDAKDAEIKYLKKQRSDLFTAYKRQLYLIDNLRQQNICVEQAKMIDFCENEFSKVLEWNLRP